LLCIDIVICKN